VSDKQIERLQMEMWHLVRSRPFESKRYNKRVEELAHVGAREVDDEEQTAQWRGTMDSATLIDIENLGHDLAAYAEDIDEKTGFASRDAYEAENHIKSQISMWNGMLEEFNLEYMPQIPPEIRAIFLAEGETFALSDVSEVEIEINIKIPKLAPVLELIAKVLEPEPVDDDTKAEQQRTVENVARILRDGQSAAAKLAAIKDAVR